MGGEAEGEGEAGSPLSREPDMGFNPRTLRSQPEPKADAKWTEPPKCPSVFNFSLLTYRDAIDLYTDLVFCDFTKPTYNSARIFVNLLDLPCR